MTTNHKSIIGHIEKYLGTIQGGWSQTPDGTGMGFQVVECLEGRIEGARSFCTLGLSRHRLSSVSSSREIRQELLIMAPTSFGSRNIPAVLQQLALAALKHHSAYLRGEIIERVNPILPDKPFYAFYAAIPTILPDAFGTYADPNGDSVVFAWMVPITKPEADFVRRQGWKQFEDLVADKKVDLLDFDRESAV